MNFTEILQGYTGKPLADCTDQELYLALLEIIRHKSAGKVQPAQPSLLQARTCRTSRKLSRSHPLATAVLAVWLPAFWIRWQHSTCREMV